MNDFKISWSKIIVWTLIFVIGFAFWIFLAWKFSSCRGCFDSAQHEIYEPAKRDTAAQKKIDSLNREVRMQEDSIIVLNEKLNQVERSRHENIVKFKTEQALAEIKPMSELYPQMRFWLSPGRPLLRGEYIFDSLDVLSMAKKKNESEYLFRDNELLGEENSLLTKKVERLNYALSDEKLIVKLKDDQINKLEIASTQLMQSKRKWYTDAAIIIGSIAVGFTIGKLTKK